MTKRERKKQQKYKKPESLKNAPPSRKMAKVKMIGLRLFADVSG
jgi:hypothetical protein